MFLEAILHQPYGSFAFPVDGHTLRVRIRTKRDDVEKVTLLHGDRYQLPEFDTPLELKKVASDLLYDYYSGDLYSPTRRIRYTFFIEKGNLAFWYGDLGFSTDRKMAGDFQYPFINEQDLFTTPEWAKKGIVYQIFPERFFNGNPANDPKEVEEWGEKPTPDNFFGGDLEGITQKLPYLKDLGVNVLYLTPIFQSPSNHKYNTTDYYTVDPHFGDLETVKELVREAHEQGIRVIFDAVFNHCGADFFAFRDVLEKGEKSPYKDWFYIHDFPIVTNPHPNYETFAVDVWTMPKLKTSNPEVRDYLLKVARYWIEEAGIDGWRLDVANEVDHDFWREFRKAVKEANPEALIIGEIWHDASPWLEGDQYDSVMNYLFREALCDFFAKGTIGVRTFDARLAKARMKYRDQANFCMFNLIDSHDTERFLTASNEKEERLRLAAFFQMTYLGMPMIYYGTEIGMTGENDPDCRRTFEWDEEKQNLDLREYYKRLIAIRLQHAPLTHGDFRTLLADDLRNLYLYSRSYQGETMIMALHVGGKEERVDVAVPQTWKSANDLLSGERIPVADGKVRLTLKGYQGVILRGQ
ncbi:glycoside hydrolase family 13 protein [Thermicanus aegyptius]|uniref:glycoside hydrolase family 13 protein n=1 Tax=Thermicanus aegyptius TaxID=94009 RepID=UPI0004095D72|nr:glycoside hydrolase family 13 protein [Thermicanus aegyptius]